MLNVLIINELDRSWQPSDYIGDGESEYYSSLIKNPNNQI